LLDGSTHAAFRILCEPPALFRGVALCRFSEHLFDHHFRAAALSGRRGIRHAHRAGRWSTICARAAELLKLRNDPKLTLNDPAKNEGAKRVRCAVALARGRKHDVNESDRANHE
jgi:hypothetical protein